MSQREKRLTAVVRSLVLLWGGNWAWQTYSTRYNTAVAARSSAATELQSTLGELQRTRAAVRKLRDWQQKSLPADVNVAQSQYRAWLLDKLQEASLEIDDVSPRQAGGVASDAYQALTYEVKGEGTLEQVVRFLDTFYRSDQLHKLSVLRLFPQEDGKRVRVTLSIEALVVSGTKRETGLSDGVSDRLALPTADDYVERIGSRNPFVAYEPPPPPKPKVAEQSRPTPPPKPEFDHAKHAKLTAVVSVGDDYQAWVTVQTLGEKLFLKRGDKIEVGQFKGTVVEVFEQEMVVETDAGVVTFGMGEALSEGRLLTAEGPAGS